MKSTYSINSSIKALETDSVTIDRQGFDIIDVKYANGYWFSAYGKNIGKADTFVNKSVWYGEPTFNSFTDRIELEEADGYELTDIEYRDDGYWVGVFGSGVVDSELIVAEDIAEFDEQVQEFQDLDSSFSLEYQVVDIEYTDDQIVGVVNKTSGDVDYTFSDDFDEFTGEVQRQRKEGLELVNLEYVDGYWSGIFSDELSGLSIYSPAPYADINDFTAEIKEFRSEGFDLINIESIEGGWFGIYKENVDGTDDIITPSDEAAIADPVGNTIDKIVIPGLIDSVFNP